jgi:hypothetical protein
MEDWGFTPSVVQQIADAIGEAAPPDWQSTRPSESVEDLPNILGHGVSNSYLLRLASVVARALRGDRIVELVDLLIAAIELPLVGIQF